MNKTELVRSVAKEFDLPLNKTNKIIFAIIENITKALAKGDNMILIDFGTFTVKKRKARKGRNPQTGETIKIPARKIVRFVMGKALKEGINKK